MEAKVDERLLKEGSLNVDAFFRDHVEAPAQTLIEAASGMSQEQKIDSLFMPLNALKEIVEESRGPGLDDIKEYREIRHMLTKLGFKSDQSLVQMVQEFAGVYKSAQESNQEDLFALEALRLQKNDLSDKVKSHSDVLAEIGSHYPSFIYEPNNASPLSIRTDIASQLDCMFSNHDTFIGSVRFAVVLVILVVIFFDLKHTHFM